MKTFNRMLILGLSVLLTLLLFSCTGENPEHNDQTAVPSDAVSGTEPAAHSTKEPAAEASPTPPTIDIVTERIPYPEGFEPISYNVKEWSDGYGNYRLSFGNRSYFIGADEPDYVLCIDGAEGSITEYHAIGSDCLEAVTDKGFFVNSDSIAVDGLNNLLPLETLFYFNGATGDHIEVGPSVFNCVIVGNAVVGIRLEYPDDKGTIVRIVKIDLDSFEYTELAVMEFKKGAGFSSFYGRAFDDKNLFFTLTDFHVPFMQTAKYKDLGIYMLDVETGSMYKVSEEGVPLAMTADGVLQYCTLPRTRNGRIH